MQAELKGKQHCMQSPGKGLCHHCERDMGRATRQTTAVMWWHRQRKRSPGPAQVSSSFLQAELLISIRYKVTTKETDTEDMDRYGMRVC